VSYLLLARIYVKLNNKQHAKGAYESAIRNSQTGNALNVGGSTLATTYLEYSQFLLDSGSKSENYSKIFENLNKAYQVSSANDDDLHGKIFKLHIELENGENTPVLRKTFQKIIDENPRSWKVSVEWMGLLASETEIDAEIMRCLSLGVKDKNWLKTAITLSSNLLKSDLIMYSEVSKASLDSAVNCYESNGSSDEELACHILYSVVVLGLKDSKLADGTFGLNNSKINQVKSCLQFLIDCPQISPEDDPTSTDLRINLSYERKIYSMGLIQMFEESDPNEYPKFDNSVIKNVVSLVSGLKTNISLNFRRSQINGMDELQQFQTQIPPSLDHYVWQILVSNEAVSSTHEREHAVEHVFMPIDIRSREVKNNSSFANGLDCNAYIFCCSAWGSVFEGKEKCLPSGVEGAFCNSLQQEFWVELFNSYKTGLESKDTEVSNKITTRPQSAAGDSKDFLKSSSISRVRKFLQALRSTGQFIPYQILCEVATKFSLASRSDVNFGGFVSSSDQEAVSLVKYSSKLFSFVFKKDGKPLRNWTPTRATGVQGKSAGDLSSLFATEKNLQNVDNGVQEGWRDMYYVVSAQCSLLNSPESPETIIKTIKILQKSTGRFNTQEYINQLKIRSNGSYINNNQSFSNDYNNLDFQLSERISSPLNHTPRGNSTLLKKTNSNPNNMHNNTWFGTPCAERFDNGLNMSTHGSSSRIPSGNHRNDGREGNLNDLLETSMVKLSNDIEKRFEQVKIDQQDQFQQLANLSQFKSPEPSSKPNLFNAQPISTDAAFSSLKTTITASNAQIANSINDLNQTVNNQGQLIQNLMDNQQGLIKDQQTILQEISALSRNQTNQQNIITQLPTSFYNMLINAQRQQIAMQQQMVQQAQALQQQQVNQAQMAGIGGGQKVASPAVQANVFGNQGQNNVQQQNAQLQNAQMQNAQMQQLQNAQNAQNLQNAQNTQLFGQKSQNVAIPAATSKPASQTNTPGSTPVNAQTNSPFNFNTPKTVQKPAEKPVEKPVANLFQKPTATANIFQKPNMFAKPAESKSPAPIGPPKPETPKTQTFMFAKAAEKQVETPKPAEKSSPGRPFKFTSPTEEQNSKGQAEKESFSFSMSPAVKSNTKKPENTMFKTPNVDNRGNIFVEQKPSFQSPLIKNNESAPAEATADTNEPHDESWVVTNLSKKIVDVKTGEEDEEVKFQARSKLFRFVNGEWKERGVGQIKILQDRANLKYRILMRRDQVMKLCANHSIVKGMNPKAMANSAGKPKGYMWFAQDYSDEEEVNGKMEQLCAKFRTPEDAEQFFTVFGAALGEIGVLDESFNTTGEAVVANEVKLMDTPKLTKQKSQEKLTFSFGEKSAEKPVEKPASKPAFSFGSTASPAISEKKSSFMFGKPAEKQVEAEAPKPAGAFCFGASKNTEEKSVEKKSEGIFGFGKASTGAAVSSGFGGLASGSTGFAFGQKSDTPAFGGGEVKQIGSPAAPHNEADGEYDPHYDALVTLKEVKVETGEENEECLFSERSKLYRFVEGEWKERGVGDLRILANKADNSKQRIVMRREVVKKLCANHFLRQGMTTSTNPQMGEKSVTWFALDFSDPDEPSGQNEQLAARFKSIDAATKFQETFKNGVLASSNLALPHEITSAPKVEKILETLVEKPNTDSKPAFSFGAPSKPAEPKQSDSKPAFSFGAPTASKTENKPAFNPCASMANDIAMALNDGMPVEKSSVPKPAFSFGVSSAATTTSKPASSAFNQFKFGDNSSTDASSAAKPAFSFGLGADHVVKIVSDGSGSEIDESSYDGSYSGDEEHLQDLESEDEEANEKDDVIVIEDSDENQNLHEDWRTVSDATNTPNDSNHSFNTSQPSFNASALGLNTSKDQKENKENKPAFGFGSNTTSTAFGSGTNTNTGFSFGSKKPESPTKPVFAFGSLDKSKDEKSTPEPQKSGFTFGSTTKNTEESSQSPSTGLFGFGKSAEKTAGFGGLGNSGFQFGQAKATGSDSFANKPVVSAFGAPAAVGAPVANENGDKVWDPEYAALVTLKEITVETGEEDETEIFKIRSKLFRFVDGEWKERGVGDIKIMESKKTSGKSSFRVIMRRDQVGKLCANHYITAGQELGYMVGQTKQLTWFAKDYSDPEEPKVERLCGKFRKEEDAKAFMQIFKECAEKLNSGSSEVEFKTPENKTESIVKNTIESIDMFKNKLEVAASQVEVVKDPIRLTPLAAKPESKPLFAFGDNSSSKPVFSFGKTGESKTVVDSGDEVEFVKEITGTDSEKEKAEKLGLPSTFYLYERGIYLHKNNKVDEVESAEEEDLLARFSEKFDTEPLSTY